MQRRRRCSQVRDISCAFELPLGNDVGVMLAARHSECAQWVRL